MTTLALAGNLMARLPYATVPAVLAAAMIFAFVLDQIKRPVMSVFGLL